MKNLVVFLLFLSQNIFSGLTYFSDDLDEFTDENFSSLLIQDGFVVAINLKKDQVPSDATKISIAPSKKILIMNQNKISKIFSI